MARSKGFEAKVTKELMLWLLISCTLLGTAIFFGEYWAIILFVIHIFLGMASYALSPAKSNWRRLLMPFTVVGPLAAASVILRFIFPEVFQRLSRDTPGLACIVVFPMIGMIFLFVAFVKVPDRKKRCTIPVTAECVELLMHKEPNNVRGRIAFCPVYVFRHNGVLHQVCDNIYTNGDPIQEKEKYTIYINPEDPEDFYDPNRGPTSIAVILILGFGFTIPGLCLTVWMILRSINNW